MSLALWLQWEWLRLLYRGLSILAVVGLQRTFLFRVFFFVIGICLLLAALGRGCIGRAFSSCSWQRLSWFRCMSSFLPWLPLLSAGSRHPGSVLVAVGLERGLSSGTRAQLLCSMWNLPGPGIQPVSPALAGRFFFFFFAIFLLVLAGGFLTTRLLGKPWSFYFLSD